MSQSEVVQSGNDEPSVETVQRLFARMREQADKVVVGQERAFEALVVSLLVGGNVLLEGVPGTAKTLMAKTLALLVSGEFRRVQFTPDLMPSDIVGTNVFDINTSRFTLRRGPIFCSLLLADEINRAPAKTQSALLESMEEAQVTIEGTRYPLPPTFMVVATQNPVEYEGTYPLPEAQLDRFLFKVLIDYSPDAVEQEVLRRYHRGFDPHNLTAADLHPIADEPSILAARAVVQTVKVDDAVLAYIGAIGRETRKSPDVLLGSSIRGSIALLQASKALAAMRGRDYVVPDDVKELVYPTMRHRIILKPEAEVEGLSADDVLGRSLARLEVPR